MPDSSERQQHILDTTLELVAEQGLLQASIGKISKRAKCSAGIIYHYFESKDEIMSSLYRNMYKDLMTHLLLDSLLERPRLERYTTLWLRQFDFHVTNPAKSIFIEQYKHSSYYTEQDAQFTYDLLSDLMTMVQADIQQGYVIDLPLNAIYTMTLGVAGMMAEQQIEGGLSLDDAALNTIAEKVCRTVML